MDGRNCSVPIPRERFDLASWYDPDDNKAGKSRTAKAALIDGYDLNLIILSILISLFTLYVLEI